MGTNWLSVNKNTIRLDAEDKVTGKAVFAGDFRTGSMLYGKIIRSPYAHAKILKIDTSKAEALPGVKAVVTLRDVPTVPISYSDRFIFPPDNIVRCMGEPVATIAAENEQLAEEAAGLVNVEYQQLPVVISPQEAFKINPVAVVHPEIKPLIPDRPNVYKHNRMTKGDVYKAFDTADLIVENTYFLPKIQHASIEPYATIAWFETDGTLRLKTTFQGVHQCKKDLCNIFNLSPDKVIIECPYLGGGFGGKMAINTEPYAIVLSQKAGGVPVNITMTRDEFFIAGRSRIATQTYIKDGVKKDGTIIGRLVEFLVDGGPYTEGATLTSGSGVFGVVGAYKYENLKFDSYALYTNSLPSGAFRGFGVAEMLWAVENQMDTIADKLKLDPVELRKRNLIKKGEKDVSGQLVSHIEVAKCLDEAKRLIGWGEKTQNEGQWRTGKGIALANKFTVAGMASSATVKVNLDESIEVRHSSHEIGQGVNTIVAQIVAESFQTQIKKIKVISGDTRLCPPGDNPASQRDTIHVGNALIMACDEAKKELLKIASARLGIGIGDLELRGLKIYILSKNKYFDIKDLVPANIRNTKEGDIQILGKATFQIVPIPPDPKIGQSPPYTARSYGAQAVEVAVDTETGQVRVLKNAGCFDCGTPINPKSCEAQSEGAMAMALGSALYEEQVMNENGIVVNPNFHDYRIPTVQDLPKISYNIAEILNGSGHPIGPFGAKGIGETGITSGAPAISNAIFNAIGVRIRDLPITSEKILLELKHKKQGNCK